MKQRTAAAAMVAATLATAIPVSGCASEGTGPSSRLESDQGGGKAGVDCQLGRIKLINVHVSSPDGSGYPLGSTARAHLLIFNDGAVQDGVSKVTTPAARRVVLHDGRGPGDVRPVGELTLPPQANQDLRHGDKYLELVGLTEKLRSGNSIPITFHLAIAGPITIQTPVD